MTVTSILSLVVSGVAALVALVMYLIERTRRQATPSWQPRRTVNKDEPNPTYAQVRDQGRIFVVGEGAMEGASLDVVHGTLISDTGNFPRSFTSRDGSIDYRFIAHRKAIEDGQEPIVALYWWQLGTLRRKLMGMRLHTLTLRYEELSRSALRPWRRTWKQVGRDPIEVRYLTESPSSRFGIW